MRMDAMGTGRDEFDPSAAARRVLSWAQAAGAATLGDALEMLDALESTNDAAEVLGERSTVDDVREELELGVDLVGDDRPLDELS
jgi:hypothetical protein